MKLKGIILIALTALGASAGAAHFEGYTWEQIDRNYTAAWPSIEVLGRPMDIRNLCVIENGFATKKPIAVCVATTATNYACHSMRDQTYCRSLANGEVPKNGEYLETRDVCTKSEDRIVTVKATYEKTICEQFDAGRNGGKCLKTSIKTLVHPTTYDIGIYDPTIRGNKGPYRGSKSFEMPAC